MTRAWAMWLATTVWLGAACSSGNGPSDAAIVVAAGPADAGLAPQAASAELQFPRTARSLRLRRSVAVHSAPALDSSRVGTIARDIRVTWGEERVGPGCELPWVRIDPRGWVCGRYLEASERAPYGVELPRLGPGSLVPGAYGKVIREGATTYASAEAIAAGEVKRTLAGSVKVRKQGELAASTPGSRPKQFWKIDRGEYLAADAIRPIEPSAYHGVRLGDDTGLGLPLGFARKGAAVRTDGRVLRRLREHEVVPVLARDEPAGHRVGEGMWVAPADLRIAELLPPPAHTEPGERWVDVDLETQILVAYEGELPVYATLISSGSAKYPSETGIFRIWVKFSETDMNGQMGDDAPYSVATVPWTQFYAKDLALHTAYWHDRFGRPLSHGCLNLAPIDARFLYFWSQPGVPPGWSMAHGAVEHPGSMVRVRSAEDPDPQFKGYARRVHQARAARSADNP